MAGLKFIVTKTDGTTVEKNAQLSDADVERVLAWALATLPDQYDAEAQPVARTVDWAVGRWLEGVLAETLSAVRAWQQAQAAKAAVEAVQPINVTLT